MSQSLETITSSFIQMQDRQSRKSIIRPSIQNSKYARSPQNPAIHHLEVLVFNISNTSSISNTPYRTISPLRSRAARPTSHYCLLSPALVPSPKPIHYHLSFDDGPGTHPGSGRNCLIPTPVRATVGEEEVDNHAQNGEKEDAHGPQ